MARERIGGHSAKGSPPSPSQLQTTSRGWYVMFGVWNDNTWVADGHPFSTIAIASYGVVSLAIFTCRQANAARSPLLLSVSTSPTDSRLFMTDGPTRTFPSTFYRDILAGSDLDLVLAPPEVGPPYCDEIRRQIAGLQLLVERLQQELQTASPAMKADIVSEIRSLQDQMADLALKLDDCVERPPRPVRNLTIAGVERTQATQFFRSILAPCPDRPGIGSPCPDNAVPLVAGKPTIVRVYVDVAQVPNQPTVENITGVLETRQESASTPNVGITPYNAPIRGQREFEIDRGQAGETLNFRIPASWCRGRLNARVTVFDPSRPGEFGYTGAPAHFVLNFLETASVKIRLIRIRYKDPQGLHDAPAPTNQDFWMTMEYVLKTYPIPTIQLVADTEELYDGNFRSFFASGGPEAQGTTGTIYEILDRYRATENLPSDVVYMALIPGPPANKTSAGHAISQRIISQVSGPVAAQELGHLSLGNPHAPCGQPPEPDTNYPTYGEYPMASIGEFGFDFVTSEVHDPARTFDFMSYCRPAWVSPYTYERLLRSYRTAAAAHPGGPYFEDMREDKEEVLDVHLTVARDGRALIYDPAPMDRGPIAGGNGDRTPYLVELYGAEGILESRRVVRSNPYHDSDGAYEDFDLSIPSHPNATRVVVTREGEVLASYELGASSPTVEMKTTVEAEQALVEWKASGGDGPISVRLRYSSDGGRSWRLVATGNAEDRADVDLAEVPGSDAGILEVIATARGKEARARSNEFRVEAKPKQAVILSPADSTSHEVGSNVYLYGAAQSADGSTAPSGLKWKSDVDGYLGEGHQVILHGLRIGRHRLTLEADDGAGGATTASVFVTVTPRTASPISASLALGQNRADRSHTEPS